MQFLTCEPNLNRTTNYLDEADVFYKRPSTWLKQNMPQPTDAKHDSHLVMFNELQARVIPFLRVNNYTECARFLHTHAPEGRVGSHVTVMCHANWLKGKETVERHRKWMSMSI